MTTSRLAVSLSTVLALAAFACSGAPADLGTGTGTKSSTKTGTDKTTGTGADNTAGTGATKGGDTTPSTPLSDTAACGQKATSQACGDCCLAAAPTAMDAADQVWGDCVCAAAACQTACAASVCAATQNQNVPTAACETCLNTNGPACETKATATCDADATCKAAEACLATNCDPIAAKEDAANGGSGNGSLPKEAFSGRGALSSSRLR